MALPDIPTAKRAGLPVDLDRLTAEGDDWLSPEERHALKSRGVCAQAQPGVFMIRVRTSGGRVFTDAVRGLADLADRYGKGWLHLTTRQQIQLHHIDARHVTTVIARVEALGLTTSSTCGHTMRGVMSCADAGVGLDEPFDCYPDARAVSDWILAQTPRLNWRMPSRFNFLFGGCEACRDHAKVNEAGFVSVVCDGELGYELWVGGSLGKSVPTLGFKAVDFVPRTAVLAAADALIEVFTTHGDLDKPNKARMKFLIASLGKDRFCELFEAAYARARRREYPPPAPLSTPLSSSLVEILAYAPEGGWGSGVRPQRVPGRAMVTVNVPLGDLDVEDAHALADLADSFADEQVYLTKNQNAMFRHVSLEVVPAIRTRLEALGLGLEGADQSVDVRVCTGGPVCALAITPAQAVAAQLLGSPVLVRNSGVRVHISGCPNNCAQHQIADIGFSGGKVTIGGRSRLGYQVWLGGDLRADLFGRVVGRITEVDVPSITEVIVGVWEALRDRGETLSETVNRVGVEGFKTQIGTVFTGLWEPGPEPEQDQLDHLGLAARRVLPLVMA
ncbi:MAG: nitrite/sulfite reductase [Egibacteraceae bacterium]